MKMMRFLAHGATVLGGLMLLSSSSQAQFTVPFRGQPDTTYQQWSFDTGIASPDGGWVNPYGTPTGTLFGATLNGSYQGHNWVYGVPNQGKYLQFNVPNADELVAHHKEVWVQMLWWNPGTANPRVEVYWSGWNWTDYEYFEESLTDGWWSSLWKFSMDFCPVLEQVFVDNTGGDILYVDQVTIDTLCEPVPEPGTLVAPSIGTLVWAARRRRRWSRA